MQPFIPLHPTPSIGGETQPNTHPRSWIRHPTAIGILICIRRPTGWASDLNRHCCWICHRRAPEGVDDSMELLKRQQQLLQLRYHAYQQMLQQQQQEQQQQQQQQHQEQLQEQQQGPRTPAAAAAAAAAATATADVSLASPLLYMGLFGFSHMLQSLDAQTQYLRQIAHPAITPDTSSNQVIHPPYSSFGNQKSPTVTRARAPSMGRRAHDVAEWRPHGLLSDLIDGRGVGNIREDDLHKLRTVKSLTAVFSWWIYFPSPITTENKQNQQNQQSQQNQQDNGKSKIWTLVNAALVFTITFHPIK